MSHACPMSYDYCMVMLSQQAKAAVLMLKLLQPLLNMTVRVYQQCCYSIVWQVWAQFPNEPILQCEGSWVVYSVCSHVHRYIQNTTLSVHTCHSDRWDLTPSSLLLSSPPFLPYPFSSIHLLCYFSSLLFPVSPLSFLLSPPGLIHDDLKVFLMNNVPQGKKKSKVLLGVADPKLGATIQETLDIHCQSGEV